MPASLATTQYSVLSLVGFQGSGKSTLAKHLANKLGCAHLEMSKIVEAIHIGMSRDELPKTAEKTKTDPNWLAGVVFKLIQGESVNRQVVLSGVREPQIHKFLLEKKCRLHSFEIKASPFLRYERVSELGKVETPEQFLNHELDEIEMGLRLVMDKARYAVITTDESDPRALATAMKKRLKEKGVL